MRRRRRRVLPKLPRALPQRRIKKYSTLYLEPPPPPPQTPLLVGLFLYCLNIFCRKERDVIIIRGRFLPTTTTLTKRRRFPFWDDDEKPNSLLLLI